MQLSGHRKIGRPKLRWTDVVQESNEGNRDTEAQHWKRKMKIRCNKPRCVEKTKKKRVDIHTMLTCMSAPEDPIFMRRQVSSGRATSAACVLSDCWPGDGERPVISSIFCSFFRLSWSPLATSSTVSRIRFNVSWFSLSIASIVLIFSSMLLRPFCITRVKPRSSYNYIYTSTLLLSGGKSRFLSAVPLHSAEHEPNHISHTVTSRCQRYCFPAWNPAFRVPSSFLAFHLKCPTFLVRIFH